MSKTRKRISEIQKKIFATSLHEGVAEARALILHTSGRVTRKVSGGPVAELGQRLHYAIQMFVLDESPRGMRFQAMAAPMITKVLIHRGSNFLNIEKGQLLVKIGKSFGYMIGMAVYTSVIGIFATSGIEKIQERNDLSEDAKRLCVSYVHDALNYILMALGTELDHSFRVSSQDRDLFAKVLLEIEEDEAERESSATSEEANVQPAGE